MSNTSFLVNKYITTGPPGKSPNDYLLKEMTLWIIIHAEISWKQLYKVRNHSSLLDELFLLHHAMHCVAAVFTVKQSFVELVKVCMKNKL